MNGRVWFAAVVVVLSQSVSAGIPEPDVVLYGDVCVGAQVAPSTANVRFVARTAGPSGPIEVGRYKMGDDPKVND